MQNKKNIGLVILGLVFASFFVFQYINNSKHISHFTWSKGNHESNSKITTKDSIEFDTAIELKNPGRETSTFKISRTKPSKTESLKKHNLFSKDDIKQLGQLYTKSKNYLDPKRSLSSFQNSKLDTIANYRKSLQQVQAFYPEDPEQLNDFIRQRIVAINFLLLTKHLTSDDCIKSITFISENHKRSRQKNISKNLNLDAGMVSKRCATDYYEEFSHFIARRSFHPDLQAQVDYYIEQIQRSM